MFYQVWHAGNLMHCGESRAAAQKVLEVSPNGSQVIPVRNAVKCGIHGIQHAYPVAIDPWSVVTATYGPIPWSRLEEETLP